MMTWVEVLGIVTVLMAIIVFMQGRRAIHWFGALLVRDFREAEGLDINEGAPAGAPREILGSQSGMEQEPIPHAAEVGERTA